MRGRMKRDLRPLTLVAIACVACTHAVRSALQAAPLPCPISEPGRVDSSWHLVRASGFRFCVPGSWRPTHVASDSVDARVWSGKEGSVTWGVGRPQSVSRQDQVAEITGTVSVISQGSMPAPPLPPSPPQPQMVERLCPPPPTTTYTVDSIVVVVTQAMCRGTWRTTAWSTAPAVYVQGETHSAENAKLLNAIIVTIRFAPAAR